MSIRQRIPFKFSEDATGEEDRILDEQEQEELIQKLKSESESRTTQYTLTIHVLLGLCYILQIIYLFKSSKESPILALFPNDIAVNEHLPAPNLWTLTNLFTLLNLTIHLLPQSHPVRQSLRQLHSSPYTYFLPLPFPLLFSISAVPPTLALMLRRHWQEFAWWCFAPFMTWFVHSAEKWAREEAEGIQNLEKLRYDAKGA
ncbi:hypothetical protein K474DRAFT_1684890 [Panus rudis PR-1116 ss-1]|nr:hypothetical protein K474DRAFT_1684890 [Panus rudis PR-1116 ss-1]